LGTYFDDMSTIIAKAHGTVDKYLGDGIMAFWGAPLPLPAHAADACAAALACTQRLATLSQKNTPLSVRIGLATGDVDVGNIGSTEGVKYAVMGGSGNLAARLESLNKQYGTTILISDATRAAAGDAIIARPIDLVAVKGKVRGVRVFELLALTATSEPWAVDL